MVYFVDDCSKHLCYSISTIALELAFNTGGSMVLKHCSRLHPYTLEALMCTQIWL